MWVAVDCLSSGQIGLMFRWSSSVDMVSISGPIRLLALLRERGRAGSEDVGRVETGRQCRNHHTDLVFRLAVFVGDHRQTLERLAAPSLALAGAIALIGGKPGGLSRRRYVMDRADGS